MLKAGLFDDFKGATNLLLWGDRMGMEELLGGVASLLTLGRSEFSVDGPEHALAICLVDDASSTSTLQLDENGFRWTCSHDVLELAKDYIEPLRDLDGAGHQYLEIEGLLSRSLSRGMSTRLTSTEARNGSIADPAGMSAQGGERTQPPRPGVSDFITAVLRRAARD